jgi:hypothetical protein
MILNPNFIAAVGRLYPNASFATDVIIQDNADGNGPFLAAWNLPGSPPTDAQIAAAMLLPVANAKILGPVSAQALSVLLDHENRLRVLEGKQALTPAGFVAAAVALPK